MADEELEIMLWKRARSGTKSPITAAIASYAKTGARVLDQKPWLCFGDGDAEADGDAASVWVWEEGARMRLRRVRQGRKGREERRRRIKTDDRQLKAQDKSLKISTKENRCVGSREGIRNKTAATSAVGLRRRRRGKNGRGNMR